jgi:hypothetical protein
MGGLESALHDAGVMTELPRISSFMVYRTQCTATATFTSTWFDSYRNTKSTQTVDVQLELRCIRSVATHSDISVALIRVLQVRTDYSARFLSIVCPA